MKSIYVIPIIIVAIALLLLLLLLPSSQQSISTPTCILTPTSPTCTVTTCWNYPAQIVFSHFSNTTEQFKVERVYSTGTSVLFSTTITIKNGYATTFYTNNNDTTFTETYIFTGGGNSFTAVVNYVGNAVIVNGINMNVNGGRISTTGTTITVSFTQSGQYQITTSLGGKYTVTNSGTLPVPIDQTVTYYVTPLQGQCKPYVNAFTVSSYAKPTYIYVTVSVS